LDENEKRSATKTQKPTRQPNKTDWPIDEVDALITWQSLKGKIAHVTNSLANPFRTSGSSEKLHIEDNIEDNQERLLLLLQRGINVGVWG
jgi:hypothetical protein